MRKRLGIALAGALVALASLVVGSHARPTPLRLTRGGTGGVPAAHVSSSVCRRAQRLETSAVKVTENGHGVVELTVAPVGQAGGVQLGNGARDRREQQHARGSDRERVEAARAFAARRNVNQRLAILTFNARDERARSRSRRRRTTIDKALAQTPPLALQDASVRRGRAGRRAAPDRGRRRRLDRRPLRRRRHRQQRSTSSRSIERAQGRARPRLHRRPALEDLPARRRSSSSPTATGGTFSSADIARRPAADLRPARPPARAGVPRHLQLDRSSPAARQRRSRRRRGRQHDSAAT